MSGASSISNRALVTAAIMLATLMTTLDSTIANVALPHIQGSVSASPDQITWVLTSYIVASAVMTPLSGWLAGRVGMKPIFLVSICGFTIASMLCGAASSLGEIVLFRALQGLCGASMIPLSQAVLLNINPPERHAQAMALWAAGTILGPILGPVIGGWLTEAYSWRWCFYINLPIGAVALLGIWIFMPDGAGDRTRRFDFLGFGALALTVASLQFMLDRGPSLDWFSSPEIWCEALLCVCGLWVFVTHSLTSARPFFDPRMFVDRNLMAATLFSSGTGLLIFASLAILPLLMQSLMGYPALTAGLVSTPRGFGMMVVMLSVGWLTKLFDLRVLMAAGLVATAAALAIMSNFDLAMDERPLIVSGFLQGAGNGLFFVPCTTLAFATINPTLRPEATAFYNLLRNVGSSVGISVMQALAVANTQVVHASLAGELTPANPAISARLPAISDAAGALALNGEITRQATMVAYVDDFHLMLWLMIGFSPLLLFLRRPGPRTLMNQAHAAAD